MPPVQQWRFGPFRLDPATGGLWRDDDLLPLRPKSLAVLVHLVAHAGAVVSKDVLLEAVWPETVVSEGVLKTCMAQIRRVLGETAQAPQYIVTVHRRGYRFVAPVTTPGQPITEPSGAAPAYPAVEHPVQPSQHFSSRSELVVAREDELAYLHERFAHVLHGQRQVVFITGEAGIGKTTLVDTFVDQLAPMQHLWVGRGQCIEQYGASEAYLPLLEAFGQLCRTSSRNRIVEVLHQQAPSWLLQMPALLSQDAYDILYRRTRGATRERMLRELAEAVEALTADCPLLLVVEDLHWSDVSTLNWLAYVARRRMPARLLVLATYRPMDAMVHAHPLHTITRELEVHGQCAELRVAYLPVTGVATYLTRRFGKDMVADELSRIIHQRTHGNPLFMVAMVDEVVRQGLFGPNGSEAALSGLPEVVAMDAPESLRQLVEQQIEQLDPEDQQLLEAASVVGVEFPVAAIVAAVNRPGEAVEVRCTALARLRQFLKTSGTETWPDGTVSACYSFLHTLYQEVLYARVSAGQRVRWHQQIGMRKEASYGDRARDIAAEIAMHFERGQDLPRAIRYLRYAGQQAVQRGAHQEAIPSFIHALELLQRLSDTVEYGQLAIDIRLDLRTAFLPLGAFSRALDVLHEAEALARSLDDQRRLGRVSGCLAALFWEMGDQDQALASSQHALDLATTLNDSTLQHMAKRYLGRIYHSAGDYARAVDILKPGVPSPMDDTLPASFGQVSLSAYVFLVLCLAERGEFADGIAYGEAGLRLAEATGHPFDLAVICAAIGRLYLRKGDVHQAIPVLERGLAQCQDGNLPLLFPFIASPLGAAYAQSGRFSEAFPTLHQAVEESTLMQRLTEHSLWVAWLSEASLLAGRVEDAHALARRALASARLHKERGHQAWILRLLGDIHSQRDEAESEQAAAYYHQAITLAVEFGMRPLLAHCRRSLGILYAQRGLREQAQAELSTAITLYRAMEMTFWVPPTTAALTHMEGE